MSESSKDSPTEEELAVKAVEDLLHQNRPILESDAPNAVDQAEEITRQHREETAKNKKLHKLFIDELGEPVWEYGVYDEGDIVVSFDRFEGFKRGLAGDLSRSVKAEELGFTEKFNNPGFPNSEGLILTTKRENPKYKGDVPPAYVVLEGITDQSLIDLPEYRGLKMKIVRAYMLGPDGNTTVTERLVATDQKLQDHVLMSEILENPRVPKNLWQNTYERVRTEPLKMPNIVQGIKKLLKKR